MAKSTGSGFEFTVAMTRPNHHLYDIEMKVPAFDGVVASFDLCLPAWTPGSYFIRDFARNIRDVVVTGRGGERLPTTKVEKGRWRVTVADGGSGPYVARYGVYAHELTVRTSHVDATHAYGNGANLFFHVEGRKGEAQRLRFTLPEGWKASIALPRVGGWYEATEYDELVDSPFECGTHRTLHFRVRGVPHAVAIWGSGNEDARRLVRDLTRLVEGAAEFFGGLPYQRYLFIVHLAAGAGGGLEHRASQSVGIAPWKFGVAKDYRSVLGLFSHELFHAWNVKRLRPEPLGPFDYAREVHTRDLWAMEGFTSYYQWVLLLRAGLVEPKEVFEEWAKEIRDHRGTPGAKVQSVEEASFDAWIRLYRPDENSPNVSESYYRRGALLALALELSIRAGSGGKRSLDEPVRALYARYGARGIPYPSGAWAKAIGETGFDPSSFFRRFVRGRETPPFEKLFAPFGIVLGEKEAGDDRKRSDFGWKTKSENGKLTVLEVYDGRAARAAGIDAPDELVAFDGVKADDEQVKRIERDVRPGTSLDIHLFRRGLLQAATLVLGRPRPAAYELKEDPKATSAARKLYRAWLGRSFPAAAKTKAEA